MLAKPYLFLYNLLSCFGWGYVLFLTAVSLYEGETAAAFWGRVEDPLKIVQTAAVLEIFHSLFGIVPSPIFSTLMQVGSRLLILWGFTASYTASQEHWSLFLAVGSWSFVEVPRYLFYALNLIFSKVPFPVFFLRYNLFMVLYPSGITGEILQIFSALPVLKAHSLTCWYTTLAMLLLYVPGSPFMYFHMLHQRKGATLKRNATSKPQAPANGIDFPVDKKTGERSSTAINQGAFEAAAAAVSQKEAAAVKAQRGWRFTYGKHVVRNVELCAESPETCDKIAQAGLDYLHNTMEFIRNGKTMKLKNAMEEIKESFYTGVIVGTKPLPTSDYEVPYKDKVLKGKELLSQLEKWTSYGTIEPECRDALKAIATNKEWLDLTGQNFVLLGAGSAMGPLLVLLAHGATVIALDLDRAPGWKRLIELTRDSPGTLIFPLKKEQSTLKTDDELFNNAGCNLFTQTPEIKNWLLGVKRGEPLIIGGYAYLDGALFIKVAMAMDAIIAGVLAERKNAGLAFLCSPTDVFVTSEAARKAQIKNHSEAKLWQKLVSVLTFGKFLVPNARRQVKSKDGKTYSIVDGLVVAQGPNYALAKRLQHWRCMLAWRQNHIVSTNIAPSTATRSVVHNKQFAAAYGGMHHFKPMEVMYQETSNAVMGALLIHDIRNPKSFAHPDTPLTSPLQLFAGASFHGGVWRLGYKMNSIGETAAVAYYLKQYRVHLVTGLAWLVGMTSYLYYVPPHTWSFL